MDSIKEDNDQLFAHHLIVLSLSSSVSLESSVAETHDEMLQVLKEKMILP